MGASGNVGMAVFNLNQGIQESNNKKLQGKIQKQIAETNARFAENQAKDAIERGDREVNDYRGTVKRVIAEQRVSYAGQGVEVNSGSAAAVQAETETIGAINESKIRTNAWREAWGLRAQAAGYQSAGSFAEISANNEAANSLITGGMRSLDYGTKAYAEYQKRSDEKKGKL